MRKSVAFLVATLLIVLSVCLSGCDGIGSSKRIALTTENIKQYIEIYADAEAENMVYASNLLNQGYQFKEISVTGTINGKQSYKYENVEITISFFVDTWGPNSTFGQTDSNTLTATVSLDSNGNATIDTSKSVNDYISEATFVDYQIESVSGYVTK